jgi:hypothetical protein
MSRLSIPCVALRSLCLAAILGLLGTMACHKRDGGKTLYLFDGDSKSVLVWNSVGEVYDAAKESKDLPKSNRQIKSDELTGMTIAWGGLALDPTTDTLYLVSTRGKVCVIPRASTQKGTLKQPDITWFRLGRDGDDSSGWEFGQASVDQASNVLYVMATRKDGAHRVWQVSSPNRIPNGTDRPTQATNFNAPNDRRGCGLTVGTGGRFYALFGGGEAISELGGEARSGSRLRQGIRQGATGRFQTTAANAPSNLLIGADTQLPGRSRYGSLAYDDARHELYVLTGTDAQTSPKILVFGEGQFHGTFNQRPNRTLDGVPSQLRILAHPRNSDWLVGASFTQAGGRPRRADEANAANEDDEAEDRDPGQEQDRPGDQDPAPEPDPGPRNRRRGGNHAIHDGQGRASGGGRLTIWKSPNDGGTPVTTPNLPGLQEIRGVAVGGN